MRGVTGTHMERHVSPPQTTSARADDTRAHQPPQVHSALDGRAFCKRSACGARAGGGELHLPWLMAADGASAGGQHVRGLFSTDRRHQDPEYTAGLEADCGDPICCRPPHGPATRRAAGPFGDYYCDAPRGLLEDMLDFISQRGGLPAIDYVFWTGDITPDDVWASTRASYEAIMEEQVRSPT